MKFPLLALMAFESFASFAQVSYQQGYFIDQQGTKTECFIQNLDWNMPPTSLNYRLVESGETQKVDTETLSEFAIPGTRYIRADVQYDKSSHALKDLSVLSNPDWAQGSLLLKVLVDGKAKLYQYNSKQSTLFFFSVDGSPIEQLVYKEYLRPDDITESLSNRTYLAQLNNKVRCGTTKIPITDRQVPYQIKPITRHFMDFNICSGDAPPEVVQSEKSELTLRLTPGIDFTTVEAHRIVSAQDQKWSSKAGFRIGAEIQLALPFRHGKWAIVGEPNFSKFSGTDKFANSLNYQYIGLLFGVRYRFLLSDKSYIFVNGAYTSSIPLQHKQTTSGGAVVKEIETFAHGYIAGAGFAYGRYSIEARYSHSANNLIPPPGRYTYTRATVILGFKIF